MPDTTDAVSDNARTGRSAPMWKFFVYSAIGAFAFFVPFSFNGESSILLDHLVTLLEDHVPAVLPYYALIVVLAGAVYPFATGSWKTSAVNAVFSVFKLIGLAVAVMLVFDVGPDWLFDEDIGPFLMDSLVISVGLLVPIGAVFLALLVGYGLLEYVGVLLQPAMRPVFGTPGRSAIDAVASFVGSYSLGLLITNRVYRQGKYSGREAAIIATGFSTVSATFMVIVAKTVGLMDRWNTYFWLTLVITFIVTAITVRIWPLNSIRDDYHPQAEPDPETIESGARLWQAWRDARETVSQSPKLLVNVWVNLRDGVLMTMAILPSILSIGLLGIVLAEYTQVFDVLGYVFYPVTWLLQISEPLLVAKASALGVAEMFLPGLLVTSSAMPVKFVVAVVSVSQIIFFSAVVPCIVATDIPVSVPKLVVIWFERVFLTLIITIPVALLVF